MRDTPSVTDPVLHRITGLAGEVLAVLEAQGVTIPHRARVRFCEEFCERWRAMPREVPERGYSDSLHTP